MNALRRADAAGDTDAARNLTQYIRQMTGQPQESQPFVRGLAQSVAQGATFGFADEIVGAGKALLNREQDETFSEAYRRNRDRERERLGEFERAYPKTALASEIGGSLLGPGVAVARATGAGLHAAPTIGRMALRGAGAGAASGAAFGAGKAEEMRDVPIQSAVGATVGGVIGGAVPPAVEAGKRLVGMVPRTAAGRRLAMAMGRDRVTPQQVENRVQRAQALNRPIARADVGGPAMRREVETVAQRPGAGSSLIDDLLTERNRGQLDRLTNDFMRATGVNKTTLLSEIGDVMDRRKTVAQPLYNRAMSFAAEQSDDMTRTYQQVTNTPLGRQALSKARKILNVENFDEAPLMARIDAVKKGFDDVIGSAKRRGEEGIARRGVEAKNALVEQIDRINPAYRTARNAWAGPSAYLQALEDGRSVMTRSAPAEQVQATFNRLSASEQEAYRLGAVNAIITRMRQDASKEPNLLKLIRSPEMKDKLAAIIPAERRGDFFEILDLEERMFETTSEALRGSQTAQRLASQREQSQAVLATLLDIISSPLESLRNAVRAISPGQPGTSERSGEAIARSLLSPMVAGGARQLPRPTTPMVPGARAIPSGLIAAEPAIPGESSRR